MADLEERVTDLEKKFKDFEIDINNSLNEIKISLAEILGSLKNESNSGDLKNALIEKDIKSNTEKIIKLEEKVKEQEESKKWLVRLVFGSIIGLVLEAVAFYIRTKP